jgi:hypothetical protein
LEQKVAALISDPKYESGVGPGGQKYEFTMNDKEAIMQNVKVLTEKLGEKMAVKDLGLMAQMPDSWKITNDKLGEGLLKMLQNKVREYVFTVKKDETLEAEIEVPVTASDDGGRAAAAHAAFGVMDDAPTTASQRQKLQAKLPKFAYTKELRQKAAPLISPGFDDDSADWGVAERGELKREFKKLLTQWMGCKEEKKCDISKIKVDDIKVVTPASLSDEEKGKLKKAVTKWFIENKSILGNF